MEDIPKNLQKKFLTACNDLNQVVLQLKKQCPEAILLFDVPASCLYLCTKPQETETGEVIIDPKAITAVVQNLDICDSTVFVDPNTYPRA
jgi:hypothetical protein